MDSLGEPCLPKSPCLLGVLSQRQGFFIACLYKVKVNFNLSLSDTNAQKLRMLYNFSWRRDRIDSQQIKLRAMPGRGLIDAWLKVGTRLVGAAKVGTAKADDC